MMMKLIYKVIKYMCQISQRESSNKIKAFGCGKKCIEMLLNRHDIKTSTLETVPSCNLRTMKQIVDFMSQNGFRAEGVKFNSFISLLHFRQNSGPDILFLLEKGVIFKKLRHWVIFEKINDSNIALWDPHLGYIWLSIKEFKKLWRGYAIILRRNIDTVERNHKTV